MSKKYKLPAVPARLSIDQAHLVIHAPITLALDLQDSLRERIAVLKRDKSTLEEEGLREHALDFEARIVALTSLAEHVEGLGLV